VFVYFNNDQHAAAVANARTMIRMARRRGLALPR
jgi:cob(I)alamin adenosyltransferase